MLTRSAAVEITIRYLLLRPLVQGAFLSDEWAKILTSRVVNGRSKEDRGLLPNVLRRWGIEITQIRLAGGASLWQTVVETVCRKRNEFVHCADTVTEKDASLALDCARALLAQVVYPLSMRLGFTLGTTGKWHQIRGAAMGMTFSPKPFPR